MVTYLSIVRQKLYFNIFFSGFKMPRLGAQ